MSRRPFLVLDELEQALCEYTGAPHAVAVDSCCNALLLALVYHRLQVRARSVRVPRHTYVGVPVAVWNAGHDVEFTDSRSDWQDAGYWRLTPTNVYDSARFLRRGMYNYFGHGNDICLSFSMEKHLPVGRGGAILTADEHVADWFIKARHDGRTPGDPNAQIVYPSFHVNMTPDVAARALWLLDHLPDRPEPLEPTDYPDLEAICSSAAIIARNSVADSRGAESLA